MLAILSCSIMSYSITYVSHKISFFTQEGYCFHCLTMWEIIDIIFGNKTYLILLILKGGILMKTPPKEITESLLEAMDIYEIIGRKLIKKLISETKQPKVEEIIKGNYFLISNAELLNGEEHLSDDWYFDVHGEHCMFQNMTTGQKFEISLGNEDSIGNLDPYFFYDFLKTTESLAYLIEYFKNPFNDMMTFFEELEKQGVLIHISGVEYRKHT